MKYNGKPSGEGPFILTITGVGTGKKVGLVGPLPTYYEQGSVVGTAILKLNRRSAGIIHPKYWHMPDGVGGDNNGYYQVEPWWHAAQAGSNPALALILIIVVKE